MLQRDNTRAKIDIIRGRTSGGLVSFRISLTASTSIVLLCDSTLLK